ncbi:MAG TPA: RecX family transcriptional regulator [Candidatus Saccharimonadaceae bacterium]|nr:RecX family transcriptional regulator [Candidatus Saccharimonadaceae bacterium]
MKITAISAQVRNPDRVNISIDGKYRFSLDIFQLADLSIKVGRELDETELAELEQESEFGKLYTRALEYTMLRPHSAREIRDYLWRKTRPRKYLKKTYSKKGSSFDRGNKSASRIVETTGVSKEIAERVFDRLQQKGYVDDEKFTRFWVENRNQRKGMSQRKLAAELHAKGVESSIIDAALANTERNDADELKKIIAKKRNKYADEQKLMAYLARQGFRYDDIKDALASEE